MKLHYCEHCGAWREVPAPARIAAVDRPTAADRHDYEPAAIAEWQAEIKATCAHVPTCRGPWQHAVQIVLDQVKATQARKMP